MFSYLSYHKVSINDVINDIEKKFTKYNKNILKKIYRNIFKNKTEVIYSISYYWIKEIIFNEIQCLYETELNLIFLKNKLPDELIEKIRTYIQLNFIYEYFLN